MTIFNDKKTYIFDGAMGTQLMLRGVPAGKCFEELNLTAPDIVYSVHKSYVDAGADIIETNTFGGTKNKLKGYGLEGKFHKINFDAVRIAKKAAAGKALIAASMGPFGELMEPIGAFSFDQAFDEFSAQAKVFEEAGADLISIETMSDIQEARAALIAVKSTTKLPVIVHLTYSENGKTNTGTPPEVATAVFEALGADAIGANCSSGPQGLVKIAKVLLKNTNLPISIMANAGNPEIVGDETVYRMTPEKFLRYAVEMAKLGVKFIGGCCGTGPEHIKRIKSEIRSTKSPSTSLGASETNSKFQIQNTKLASRTEVLEVKPGKVVIIGERINPTNRKDLQEDMRQGKTSVVRQNAVSQVAAGADMLDINVGMPDIDELKAIKNAVLTAESSVSVPLCIDSSNPGTLEEGLKTFAGKALVNSVNGKEESLNAVLPLVKKYGAAVIGLTLEKGIPSKASERLKIAEKIVKRAVEIGIKKENIFIDALTLAAGAQQEDVAETLKAIKLVKSKLKVKAILGVSNVSHGLPARKQMNAAFLKLAVKTGLDAAIYNPENLTVKVSAAELKAAEEVFLNKDRRAKGWIEKYGGRREEKKKEERIKGKEKNIAEQIFAAVVDGDRENIVPLIESALKEKGPQNIIDGDLLPAMEEVGKRFNDGRYFIPQVMASAEAMKVAFERVKKEIKPGDRKMIGIAVIATVLGDIHDIGKNIVSMLLENHGFNVVDLGKDVPPEKIVLSAKENKADVILLSALLTTTMPGMKIVKAQLEKEGLNIPVMVGGAPVTSNYAKSFGANFAKDAVEAVRVAKNILKNRVK
ncbi:MAG: homocysteine S-methyltransferase family protein [Candidatus Saganbacteria bacterium]|nr:homocysteine S-methyltransferase family protein [Candidatus Saganbacteria bacterium]